MFTGHSVGARHLAIKPVIGTFEEEDEAFDKMMLLTWLMPLLVAVATTIDGVLMAMMMTVLHPWRRILQEVKNNFLAFFITPTGSPNYRGSEHHSPKWTSQSRWVWWVFALSD